MFCMLCKYLNAIKSIFIILIGVYAMFSRGHASNSNNALLSSETMSATNGRCLSFWYILRKYYSVKGYGINVYMNGEKNVSLASYSTPTDYSWFQTEIGLYSKTEFKISIEGIIPRGIFGLIAIDDINIKDGNCVGSCSSLLPTARVACGPSMVTAISCVRKYGCCFSNSDHNSISCYYHPSSCQSIAVPLRVQCGHKHLRSYSCLRLGCCYDRLGIDLKFRCYNSPVTPTAFPTTLVPITTPQPSQYDCTFENGWCNFTNLKNDKSQWIMTKGSIKSGKMMDHTLQNEKGRITLEFIFMLNCR